MPAFSDLRNALVERLTRPTDPVPLAWFRIAFGSLIAADLARQLVSGAVAKLYVEPVFHFSYYGFSWVKPLPGAGMTVLFAVLAVLAVLLACGIGHRLVAPAFAAGYAYVFLIDESYYQNHHYLIVLLAMLLAFSPADRALSPSARGRPLRPVPAWSLFLLRAQIAIVYFYGGLAKFGAEWLSGAPMRIGLEARAGKPLIGWLAQWQGSPPLFTYGGLVFDLAIVPLLLWRRTRLFALVAATAFHATNHLMFEIGIFPWLMIAATIILFGGRGAAPAPQDPAGRRTRPAAAYLAAAYLVLQLLVPFRHHLYPGDVDWTEEGARFSWRMMTRAKVAEARFFVSDAQGRRAEVDVEDYLTPGQRMIMAMYPDMVQQMAAHIADGFRRAGLGSPKVTARVSVSLDGRPPSLLVDPLADLAAAPRTLGHAAWIMPFPAGEPYRGGK